MAEYLPEVRLALQENLTELWKFVRLPEGIWIGVATTKLFHDALYRGALFSLPEAVQSEASFLDRLSGKPLDAGFIFVINGLLFVLAGSDGFQIKEINIHRGATLTDLERNLNIELSTRLPAEYATEFDTLQKRDAVRS